MGMERSCPNCGARWSRHTGTYCEDCGEPKSTDRPHSEPRNWQVQDKQGKVLRSGLTHQGAETFWKELHGDALLGDTDANMVQVD